MSNPQKQQIGDGQDSFGSAAENAAKVAKQVGEKAAKQSAEKGAEATTKAAAGMVKAGVESGKAVSEVAAGTAAGGPWGAVIAAAWSMRHTLFKVLVCVCLAIVFLIVLIVSLPHIVFGSLFGADGEPPPENATVKSVYADLADALSEAVENGYLLSIARADEIITEGGYDRDLSMNALIDSAQGGEYDACYILAAYSASMGQQNTGKDDMLEKLNAVVSDMFPVTYEEKTEERVVPGGYYEYEPITVTVVTRTAQTGTDGGIPQDRYETAERTYYTPVRKKETAETMTVDSFETVPVTLPVYSDGKIIGTQTVSYYQKTGTQTVSPTIETIRYAECTVHPFDDTVITTAFGIDPAARYGGFPVTYAEAIDSMASALKMTVKIE